MQTFISRMGDLFSGLLPLAEQPEDIGFSAQPAEDGDPGGQEENRLPSRDESYYWAMHAHW